MGKLDKRDDSMHIGVSITDELRAWVRDGKGSLLAIADRIDVEHNREMIEIRTRGWSNGYDEGFASADDWLGQHEGAMAEHGWVRLPVDADGVPIHVGDVMDGTCPSGRHVNGTVSAIGDGVFWLSNVQFSLKPNYMHHYHAPTVEDVLREFAYGLGVPVADSYVAAAASKLRLAGDAETCRQEERGWTTEGDHARVFLTCGHDCMVETVADLPNFCPVCGARVEAAK